MAEETQSGEQQAPPPKSLLRYLPAVVVVLLIQAVGVYFLFPWVLERKFKSELTIGQTEEVPAESEEVLEPPDILPKYDDPEKIVLLDEMHANPAGTKGDAVVFFKVGLGFAPSKVESEIQRPEVMAKIKDDITAVMSSHPPEMMDQPDDKRALREEIRVRINAHLTEGEIVEVYFEKFVVQSL